MLGLLDPGGLLPFLSLFLFFSHLPFSHVYFWLIQNIPCYIRGSPALLVCACTCCFVWRSQPYNLTADPDMDSHDVISGLWGQISTCQTRRAGFQALLL